MSISAMNPWHCPACSYETRHSPDEDQRERAATHEAGHAVMRCIRGISLGMTCIHIDGTGRSAPARPKLLDRKDMIPLLLSGYGAELLLWRDDVVSLVGKGLDDIEDVWKMLSPDYLSIVFRPVLSRED